MANRTRSQRLVQKAEAAFIAAIDVYNRPDFLYREESFAILALNAWELLLKARLVAEKKSDLRCLFVYEARKTKGGIPGGKLVIKKTRSGNPHTLAIGRVIAKLEAETATRVHPAVKANLDALTEIRDNAIHLINPQPMLAKRVLEVGTAAVKNFVELSRQWFRCDLGRYNLYLMPIGLIPGSRAGTLLPTDPRAKNLLRYLTELISNSSADQAADLHVALEVAVSLKRTAVDPVGTVQVTGDPSAQKVFLTEEDVRKAFPWDYRELTRRLRERYSDFKENTRFHAIRSPLLKKPGLVRSRYLDPGNPKSAKKDFYNPNIVAEFDQHYTRKP